jgi:hypothetical protein
MIRPSQYEALINLQESYNSYYRDVSKYDLIQLANSLARQTKEVLDAFQQDLNLKK